MSTKQLSHCERLLQSKNDERTELPLDFDLKDVIDFPLSLLAT